MVTMFDKVKKAVRKPPLQVTKFFAEVTSGGNAETHPRLKLRYAAFGGKHVNFSPGLRFYIASVHEPGKGYGGFKVYILNTKGRTVATVDLSVTDDNSEIRLPLDYMRGKTLVVVE